MKNIEEILIRVQELESSIAFQDDLHTQLNEIVARQDREILELKMQLKALAGKLQSFDDAFPSGAEAQNEEIPPHY